MILVVVTSIDEEVQPPIYRQVKGSDCLIDSVEEVLGYDSNDMPALEFTEWLESNLMNIETIDLLSTTVSCVKINIDNMFRYMENSSFHSIIASGTGKYVVSKYFTL